ncbi:hypothetical protein Ciccas_005992 [Cichlidogyrus casuarinus]|uniref:Mannosyltransferase n=1 Tax=Cichlidogyrus casuarinus TaxID=1844966 RepID=A0ABD2Q876_9PLAT
MGDGPFRRTLTLMGIGPHGKGVISQSPDLKLGIQGNSLQVIHDKNTLEPVMQKNLASMAPCWNHRICIVYLPRIFHAVLAAFGDYFLFRFALKLSDSAMIAQMALFNHLSNCRFKRTIFKYFLLGFISLILSILLDRLVFGHWTCNQINFIKFNVFGNLSHIYGVESIHWYFTNAIPAMFGIQILWFLSSLRRIFSKKSDKFVAFLIIWIITCYSLIGHKEHRFILPIVPLAMYLCAQGTMQLSDGRSYLNRRILIATLSINAILVGYFGLIHQRAPLDALHSIGKSVKTWTDVASVGNNSLNALFLMPCHTCPGPSFVHSTNYHLRMLSCEPNLAMEPYYIDEADLFYMDPISWLHSYNETKPTHVLLFDTLINQFPQIEEHLLNNWGLRQCGSFWHTRFPTNKRHSHWMLVYCQDPFSLLV